MVKDDKGEIIKEWTSDNQAYVLEGILKAGETYTLVEIEAPKGYRLLNEEVQFTVRLDGQLQTLVVENEKEKSTVTKTGDSSQQIFYMTLMGLSSLGVVMIRYYHKKDMCLKRQYKSNKTGEK